VGIARAAVWALSALELLLAVSVWGRRSAEEPSVATNAIDGSAGRSIEPK
jgi:hypothetical protein